MDSDPSLIEFENTNAKQTGMFVIFVLLLK